MITEYSDKKWLVKCENKILGPYNFEQVEDLISKKQISLIDEIRDPQTRWLYIRENPEFKSIIEDVRSKIDAKSDATTTQQSVSISTTGTQSTEDMPQAVNYGLPQFTNVSLNAQEASVVSETLDENQVRLRYVENKSKIINSGNFVYQNDKRIKKYLQNYSKNFLILIAFIFVAGLASVVSFYFYNKYNQQRSESELLSQFKKYKFLGLDQQAASVYSRLPVQLQKKNLIDVIELFPIFEALGLVQLKDLEGIESKERLSLENKANIFLTRFWFFMQLQDYESAQNQIVKAKALLPLDLLVLEDEALLNLRRGKYQLAIETFISLYEKHNSGRYIMGAFQGLQGLQELNNSSKSLFFSNIEKLVDRHIALNFDYRKELLFIQMAFARIHENEVLFKLSWKQFINTPVRLSNLFKKPTLIAPFSYQWKDLESMKSTVLRGLNVNDDTIFKIHDFLESNQLSAAVDYFEKNKNGISDPYSRQQMALLLDESLNKKTDALALEQTKQLDKNSELNHIILALTKINLDPYADIKIHLDFFKVNNLKFYFHWISLSALMRQKANAEIKSYLKENFQGDSDFMVVNEARGLLE